MNEDVVTERLVLRALRADDAEAMLAYRSDPEIMRYQGWEPQSIDEVRAFIAHMSEVKPYAPGTWRQLAITIRATGELIGDCGVRVPADEPEQAEFGMTLAPAFQGRGYASEAIRALLRLAFDTLEKHRVFGSIDPRNARSIALMRRTGFRQEAHFVESLRFKGEWADDVVFAMLRREWAGHR
ncbi:MAG: GNAT family N-acetyltransferase [Candidatus Eremiobacteraeota bacterium]|nr:GNAT family N-acetyltransferase [Candidatus Eremiobacteraeota bacterium]